MTYERFCKNDNCGTAFTTESPVKVYCCPNCRKSSSRERARLYKKATRLRSTKEVTERSSILDVLYKPESATQASSEVFIDVSDCVAGYPGEETEKERVLKVVEALFSVGERRFTIYPDEETLGTLVLELF